MSVSRLLRFSKKVSKENGKKILTFEVSGKEQEISVDEILLAAGKTPNTKDIGLELAGVETNEKHAIFADQYFKTSQDHIFAVD